MMSTPELLRTPLYDWHVAHGGRMVDFAGWSMPVQYTSIAGEHHATRSAVGVFDISHMGRLRFAGSSAAIGSFLDQVATRRVTDMKVGQVRYSLICNSAGGILDDVLIYRGYPSEPTTFSLVVNASNRKKIVGWLEQRLQERPAGSSIIELIDDTAATSMIAVQGPKTIDIVSPFITPGALGQFDGLRSMRYYFFAPAYFNNSPVSVSRTGYTGEDGCEIICKASLAADIWNQILDAAGRVDGLAVGLGARDTLRLEAAMPLYGHELSEEINPIEAGLGFAVNLSGRDFIGRDAIEKFTQDESQPVRVGLESEGKRVPRQGCPVLQDGEVVGEVTSGTFSPTLGRPIAMAYVRPQAAATGTKLAADIRGTLYPATIVPLPFYSRTKKS